jgi:hypothetical protein
MNTLLKFSLLLTLALSLFSCEKVIDIDLNKDQERLVIEAQFYAGDSTHQVKITRTLNFDQANAFPFVTDAVVSITDNLGATASFAHIGNGVYELTGFPGVEGRTYTLNVLASGKTYTAVSKMPTHVPILVVSVDEFVFGDTLQTVTPVRQDPPGESNYYKFNLWKNGTRIQEINIQDDQFNNGGYTLQPVTFDIYDEGDTLELEMLNIGKPVYQYWVQLGSNTNGSGATPANPISNFSNGALGYFSAQTVVRETVYF